MWRPAHTRDDLSFPRRHIISLLCLFGLCRFHICQANFQRGAALPRTKWEIQKRSDGCGEGGKIRSRWDPPGPSVGHKPSNLYRREPRDIHTDTTASPFRYFCRVNLDASIRCKYSVFSDEPDILISSPLSLFLTHSTPVSRPQAFQRNIRFRTPGQPIHSMRCSTYPTKAV